jgi:hypothetical protein
MLILSVKGEDLKIGNALALARKKSRGSLDPRDIKRVKAGTNGSNQAKSKDFPGSVIVFNFNLPGNSNTRYTLNTVK